MNMLSNYLATLILMTSQLSSFVQADPHWHDTQFIANSFYQVALQNEYGHSDGKLHKWNSGIKYHITDRTLDRSFHKKLVSIHLQQLSNITKLEIKPSDAQQQANLHLLFSTEMTLEDDLKMFFGTRSSVLLKELSHNSVCVATFDSSPTGNINTARVIIPVDRARAHAKLLSCVVEELTQVMGLPNDSEEVYPSIFNDKSIDNFLSGLDYLLLKLLYDSRLHAGQSWQQLNNIVPKIIDEAAFQSEIQQAEQTVRKNSLEQLLLMQ